MTSNDLTDAVSVVTSFKGMSNLSIRESKISSNIVFTFFVRGCVCYFNVTFASNLSARLHKISCFPIFLTVSHCANVECYKTGLLFIAVLIHCCLRGCQQKWLGCKRVQEKLVISSPFIFLAWDAVLNCTFWQFFCSCHKMSSLKNGVGEETSCQTARVTTNRKITLNWVNIHHRNYFISYRWIFAVI